MTEHEWLNSEGCSDGGPCDNPDCLAISRTVSWQCARCKGTGRLPHPLLVSLRGAGPYYRGMWPLDLMLGKS